MGQETSINFNAAASGFYGDNSNLPFWFYSNQNGKLDSGTNFLGEANVYGSFFQNEYINFEAGIGYFYSDGIEKEFKRSELYLSYYNKFVKATFGARNPEIKLNDLSATNQNFLLSGNARSIPGILIEANDPLAITKFLSIDWGMGHYFLNDDRYVDDPMLHYKRLGLTWTINDRNKLDFKIQHFAIWGGTNPETGDNPRDFNAFWNIFLAKRGGEEAVVGDQMNALGDHLGSYFISYNIDTNIGSFNVYHEHPFEDGSGSRFANFPDGVWGLYFEPKEQNILSSVIYEYIDTTDQSGEFGSSSRDNYFNNKIYRSGWTYDERTIGLPFIIVPGNNRTKTHHIGFTSEIHKFNILFKTSFTQNLGTYNIPTVPKENTILTYLKATYSFEQYGNLSGQIGYDYNDLRKDRVGVGLSYGYMF